MTRVYNSTCNDSSSATLLRDLRNCRDSTSLPCPGRTRKSVSRLCSFSPSHSLPVSLRLRIYYFLYLSHALINLLEHQHIQSIQPHGNHSPGLNESQNESISKNNDRHTPKNAKSQVSPQRQHRLVIQESSIQLYRQKVARTSFLFSNGSLYHKITIHKNTKSIHKRVNTIHISLSLIL